MSSKGCEFVERRRTAGGRGGGAFEREEAAGVGEDVVFEAGAVDVARGTRARADPTIAVAAAAASFRSSVEYVDCLAEGA
mmetsp:Transcript_12641/g.15940  ORF Transcript_12641/g.15940 Transcript_12641/m.15940 type:complete len:80 (-) Transcript_12641:759-998(-)